MITFFVILLILISGFLLIKSSELVVYSTKKLAKDAKLGVFAVSSIILAVGTSFPELFVSVTSALEKTSELALGVVIGSNIANIALIGGLTAILAGKVHVKGEIINKDVWVTLLAGLIPMTFLLDGTLSRVDGLILIILYLAYATGIVNLPFRKKDTSDDEAGFFYRMFTKIKNIENVEKRTALDLGRLFIGIAVMLLSADAIVKLSGYLAQELHISVFIVGLFLLAIGTSLPELTFSLRSVKDHEPSMFFGNLLGSTVANSTLIIGISVLLWPIVISNASSYLFAFSTFIAVFGLFIFFVRTKKRLDRWEGLVLLIAYLLFALIEIV